MKTFATITLLAAFALIGRATEPAKPSSEEDIGTWRVARLLYYNDYGPREGLTRLQAQNRLGKTLVITTNGIAKLGRETCAPRRDIDTWQRTDLLSFNKLLPPPGQTVNLGLPEKVTVFIYDCIDLWLRADGNLVAGIDGYYFELRRIGEPHAKLDRKAAPH
jgi:hypothetical protein